MQQPPPPPMTAQSGIPRHLGMPPGLIPHQINHFTTPPPSVPPPHMNHHIHNNRPMGPPPHLMMGKFMGINSHVFYLLLHY